MTTATADAPRASTPWHYWVVTVLSLLWNGFGGYDYTMSHLQGETYYRQMGMTDQMIALMDTYPTWMHAVWAVGVWGSVLGSILLLARSRFAVPAFGVSILGALGSLAYTMATPAVRETMGFIMPVVIVVICALLLLYATRMAKRGVLR